MEGIKKSSAEPAKHAKWVGFVNQVVVNFPGFIGAIYPTDIFAIQMPTEGYKTSRVTVE